ncbi:hypothetical protein GF314_15530 [bacterium]|nr:hypothetical protein [bacterium]
MPRAMADDLRVTPWNLLRSVFSGRRRREMVGWRRLLLAARGAEDTATDLVAFEQERSPWLTREEAIEAARRRLETDRSR